MRNVIEITEYLIISHIFVIMCGLFNLAYVGWWEMFLIFRRKKFSCDACINTVSV